MKSGVQIEKARAEMHGEHLLDLRLHQIFEKLTKKIYVAPHDDAIGNALYFLFDNGIDPDPYFSGQVNGVLFASKENRSSLCVRLNDQREEVFVTDIDHFSIQVFHPDTGKWQSEWMHGHFPPMVRIKINEKVYSYIIPKGLPKAVYKS